MDFLTRVTRVLHRENPDRVPFAVYDNLVPRGEFGREGVQTQPKTAVWQIPLIESKETRLGRFKRDGIRCLLEGSPPVSVESVTCVPEEKTRNGI